MQQPPFLKRGDRIRIVSPSGRISPEKVLPAVENLQKEGFDVIVGTHAFDTFYQFAGTDENRLHDLQEALDDPECKAVICARGGYGAIRIADRLNLESFRKTPKWLVGFSDVTVLHSILQREHFSSIHGPMPGFYIKDEKLSASYIQLLQTLRGIIPSYSFFSHANNRNGMAQGELCGGNLSIIYSLLGTPWQLNTKGKILFIEDLSEYLYHLDRMMNALKLSGSLNELSALLVGSFTEMKDNNSPFGQEVEEIILNTVKDYDYPVFFDFPSGHIDENMPLVLGQQYKISTEDKSVILSPLLIS